MTSTATPAVRRWPQTLVGAGVLLTGGALAAGALTIASDAGYGGVGPNFLPWVVSIVLAACGGWLIRDSLHGGYADMDAPPAGEKAHWPAFVWVSAGLLANAALITTVGFILGCTLCYLLAVQGLRRADGQAAPGARTWAVDAVTGFAISAPVYWMFTKFLAINLPGLTGTGWI